MVLTLESWGKSKKSEGEGVNEYVSIKVRVCLEMRESKGEEIEGKMFPYGRIESGVSPGVWVDSWSSSEVISLELFQFEGAACQLNPPDLHTFTSSCVHHHSQPSQSFHLSALKAHFNV